MLSRTHRDINSFDTSVKSFHDYVDALEAQARVNPKRRVPGLARNK